MDEWAPVSILFLQNMKCVLDNCSHTLNVSKMVFLYSGSQKNAVVVGVHVHADTVSMGVLPAESIMCQKSSEMCFGEP